MTARAQSGAPSFDIFRRVLKAGLMAGVSFLAIGGGLSACAPTSPPSYELCNSAGCGDNVAITVTE